MSSLGFIFWWFLEDYKDYLMKLKILTFFFLNFGEGDMFSDPLKGPIAARKFFWPLYFQNRVVISAVGSQH